MPRVSVILTSYNHAKYISEAIDSALNQTFTDFELIIWDDCSSDNSWDLINQYSDSRINAFRSDVNKGPVKGVNHAISELAAGQYIAIHHSDDVWELDKLEKQVSFLDANPEIGAVFTNVLAISEDGSPLVDEKHYHFNIFDQPNRTRHEWLRFFFSRGNALCHPSVLVRKQCYVDCGSYRDMLAQLPDLDMWIRLCLKYQIHVLPEKFVRFRVRDNEANASASRPDSRIRSVNEFYFLLRNYLSICSFEEMVAVFPETNKYYRENGFVSEFVLSMMALGDGLPYVVQLFALEMLFRLMNDPNMSERIQSIYGFSYVDFVGISGRHDVFVVEAMAERNRQIANLNQAVAERDARIAAFGQVAIERDAAKAKVQALLHSRSWRLTAPLRGVGRLVHRVSRPSASCGLFSRAVIAVCVLPATVFHYRSLREWAVAVMRGAPFFDAVLDNPTASRKRLAGMPRLVSVPVSIGVAAAQLTRKSGGVLPLARNVYRDFATEGLRGVYVRMMNHISVRRAMVVNAPVNLRRILVADYRIPMQDVSSGERGTVGILRDLCRFGYEVVFLPNDLAPSPKYEAELHAFGVTVITSAQGYNSPVHYLRTQGHTFGAFHIFRVNVAETMVGVVRQIAPAARVIFHTVDLHFLRETREAELQDNDAARIKAKLTKERELAIMRQVDHVVVVSPTEVPLIREYLPNVHISVFPALYSPITTHPVPFEARRHIFFLGGFVHTPNVDAVQWFAKEIWPLVCVRLPDAEFHIVGSEMPQSVLKLAQVPGIKVVGFVPDLDPLLAAMRVGVAPLRFGAGIKGKVAATMGAGIPCVCTGIAAEGMHIQNGVHAMVENEPQAFANAVIKLYTDGDLWTRLSANGQELISRNFGNEANRSSLLSLLDASRALPISLFSKYCMALPPRAVPLSPAGADVDVSIIVSVYNQWTFTKACLNSILETCLGDGISFEIILADDGSSDETIRAAELYPGLRVVKTEKNVGFLRNCNNAASHAYGRHILLLNNDTIVLPGWLSSLYRTLEQDPGVAIVGSKLLYPGGLLQEAGGVLFNDGTALNVGRGQGRDTPVFNIARETDYISGASIMVRKSFWERVGGFDERYKDAYCEDADLAMTARSLGMRVVYQPASEVVHFEHQTYADQAPTHNTGLQSHNTKLMLEKWHDVFQRDHLPVATPWQIVMANAERAVPAAAHERRRQGSLSVLYFSPFPSHPASHGNRAIINQLARHFQNMGHTVHFVLLQGNEYAETDLEEMRAAWDTLDVIPYANPMIVSGGSIPFDGWYEDGLGEHIRCLCAQYDIDMVFCSYVFQSKLLEFVPSYMLKVIDTHDKMGDRYDMLRKNGQPLEFFSCTPEEEGAYLRRADVVVALREEEARYFDSVSGKHTAVVISHAEAPRFIGKDFTNIRQVGMVASANNINLTMVRECLAAIERHLQGTDCPFTVHVAGQVKEMLGRLSAKESAVFRKPWVRMHGFVRDISEFYGDMDLILSPVTMGTGINVKTVQAMAYGMPLLTTECGSKGIETGDPMHMHTNLDGLAARLFTVVEHPVDLQRLAALSRDRYVRFYDENVGAITGLFAHAKLMAANNE